MKLTAKHKKIMMWTGNLLIPLCVAAIVILQFSYPKQDAYMLGETIEMDCHDAIDNDHDGFVDHQDNDCPLGCEYSSSSYSYSYSSEYSSGNSSSSYSYWSDSSYSNWSDSSYSYSYSSDSYSSYSYSYSYSSDSSSSYSYSYSSQPLTETNCHDLVDNDGDSLTDCQDSTDCALSIHCQENCSNMLDDDGDMAVDCDDLYCVNDPACQ